MATEYRKPVFAVLAALALWLAAPLAYANPGDTATAPTASSNENRQNTCEEESKEASTDQSARDRYIAACERRREQQR